MRTRIVELVGLPGSGKSTIAERLAQDSGRATSASLSALLMRGRLHWLALPFVWRRFGQVVSRLVDRVERRSILNKLCRVTTERALANLESLARRRPVLLDEGYLQAGAGVWVRAPDSCREELWAAFTARVPGKVVCLYVALDPDEAARRTARRGTNTGVPESRALAAHLRAAAQGVVETDGASAEQAAGRALESLTSFAPTGMLVLSRSAAHPGGSHVREE